MGNGEAKEFICVTHGHELRWGMMVGGGYRVDENKGERKWDNCNSIINKIYIKKEVVIIKATTLLTNQSNNLMATHGSNVFSKEK